MSTAAVAVEPHVRARTIVGASVAGASHTKSGTSRQDAFRVLERDETFAIAVADGLGSALRSALGANVATAAAAARAIRFASGDPARATVEAFLAARDALEMTSALGGIELRALGCTLLVVAGHRGRVCIGHIGDGAVAGRAGDRWSVLSPPGSSEYLNETDPLTAEAWERRVRWTSALGSVDALAVFTDGCQHAAIGPDGAAHDGFFRPLFDFLASGVPELDARIALRNLLAGRKLGEHSDDDKTLVLAAL